mmetsp:Transcript_50215/g.92088  ORF Transcript_50215/g.92088 Transcript_50215/m.92088 type:complete len:112 (-) Transcript_50215:35-370(-)
MGGAGRIQVNYFVEPCGERLPLLKPVMLPAAWIEDAGAIDDEHASQWKNSVQIAFRVLDLLKLVFGVSALLAALLAICLYCRLRKYRRGLLTAAMSTGEQDLSLQGRIVTP